MVNMYCNCENVKIHVKEIPNTRIEDLSILNLPAEDQKDPYFSRPLTNVHLDLGGIVMEIIWLTKSRTVNEWIITTCTNCGVDTHASHVTEGLNKLIVPRDLSIQTEKVRDSAWIKSETYSPLFRMFLNSSHIKTATTGGHIDSTGLQKIESARIVTRQQLARYLHKEQEAMEERMRRYTEQQKREFEELQNKVETDQQIVMKLIELQESGQLCQSSNMVLDSLTTNLTPPMTPINTDTQTSDPMGHTGVEDELSDNVHDLQATYGQRSRKFNSNLSRMLQTKRKHGMVAKTTEGTAGIFEMEGIDDTDDTFMLEISAVDEQSEGDDDAFADDPMVSSDYAVTTNVIPNPGKNQQTATTNINRPYASSLPIGIQNSFGDRTNRFSREQEQTDSDEDELVGSPTRLDNRRNIAASIKALARSVHHQDGTEIFGDLPRPRLNTMH